ncbi:hypothetical protein EVAR_52566_1 [Eumeta japonica]|uniref:Uncharacterized protein n=1 Tax=Eumeta variegata TaxID=151549 RepID=A0A4C1YEQ7_EUMVA|nr:hypothetical protein EVAR_52566_1 [Eumeta japonica]
MGQLRQLPGASPRTDVLHDEIYRTLESMGRRPRNSAVLFGAKPAQQQSNMKLLIALACVALAAAAPRPEPVDLPMPVSPEVVQVVEQPLFAPMMQDTIIIIAQQFDNVHFPPFRQDPFLRFAPKNPGFNAIQEDAVQVVDSPVMEENDALVADRVQIVDTPEIQVNEEQLAVEIPAPSDDVVKIVDSPVMEETNFLYADQVQVVDMPEVNVNEGVLEDASMTAGEAVIVVDSPTMEELPVLREIEPLMTDQVQVVDMPEMQVIAEQPAEESFFVDAVQVVDGPIMEENVADQVIVVDM